MSHRNRGFIVLSTLIFLAGLSTLTSVEVTRSLGESAISNRLVAKQQAFYLAEAGADTVLAWFDNQPGPISWLDARDPILNMPCSLTPTGTLATGSYRICVDPDDGNGGTQDDRYSISVTATTAGVPVTRTINIALRAQNFSQYQRFSNAETTPEGWRMYRNRANGVVHTNGQLNITSSGLWTAPVSSGSASINCINGGCVPPYGSNTSGYTPNFNAGIKMGAAAVSMPTDLSYLQSKAALTLTGDTTIRLQGTAMVVTNPTAGMYNQMIPINGQAVYVNGALTLDGGDLNGQLTLGSTQDIRISNPVTYRCSPWNTSGDPDCRDLNGAVAYNDDVLGLVAQRNVLITQSAPTDMAVEAVIMAINGLYGVENLSVGPVKNSVYTYGGGVTNWQGGVRVFNSSGATVGGYNSVSELYDTRMLNMAPPFFPTTGRTKVAAWLEP